MPQIVAVIPCRYASTRLAGKPLIRFAGKPLVQHVYERVAQAAGVDRVVVATDDERIQAAVAAFGGAAVMTAARHRSGTDRVCEVADRLGLAEADVVVNVQGDQPAVDPRSIEAVVAPLVQDPLLEMTTLAFAIQDRAEIFHPKDVKVVFDHRGFAVYFSRAPIPFVREANWSFTAGADQFALQFGPPASSGADFTAYKHLGVYGFRRRFLDVYRHLPRGRLEALENLEQLRVLENGYRIKVVVSEFDSPEIDCPEDLERLQRHWAAAAGAAPVQRSAGA